MSYLPSVLGSTIECFGVFLFMFTLFRFQINARVVLSIFLVAFLLAQVSYFTRLVPETANYTTYIQFVIYVVSIWRLFRVPLFYSVIMNFAGIAGLVVVQGLTILALSVTNNISMSSVTENAWLGMSTQLLTTVILAAISHLIHRLNWGFDFIPTSPRVHVRISGTNAVLISVVTVAIALFATLTFLFRNEYEDYVLFASLVFVLTLPVFLYFSLRKDNEDAS